MRRPDLSLSVKAKKSEYEKWKHPLNLGHALKQKLPINTGYDLFYVIKMAKLPPSGILPQSYAKILIENANE